jgi:hypothetical protein
MRDENNDRSLAEETTEYKKMNDWHRKENIKYIKELN